MKELGWILIAFILGCILSVNVGCTTYKKQQSIKLVSDIPIGDKIKMVHVEYKVDF